MTFRIFKNSTTADASDTNDNYYHIGQGSRLPMGGSSLNNTNGVYDLGSSSYRWGDIYASTISTESLYSEGITWRFISKATVNTATTRLEITGINEVIDKEYLFVYMFITETSTSTQIGLFFSEQSGGSYYNNYINANGATLTSDFTAPSADGIILFDTTAPTTTALYNFGYLMGRTSGDFTCKFFNAEDCGEEYVNINKSVQVLTHLLQ